MYGVPADLPLSVFLNTTLIQICLGQYQIQFHFVPQGYISVEGRWELKDEKGERVDASQPHVERDSYRIHRIIGQDIVNFEIYPPSWFSLQFKNGYSLVIYDDSKQYESFSIQPGDIFI